MAEQEDAELTSPHKHIKSTSTCGAILTENKLETGKKTIMQPRLYRNIHTESGRKGREEIGEGSVPLGGDTEEEGD